MRVVTMPGGTAWALTYANDGQIASGTWHALAWVVDLGGGLYHVGTPAGRSATVEGQINAVGLARAWAGTGGAPEPADPSPPRWELRWCGGGRALVYRAPDRN